MSTLASLVGSRTIAILVGVFTLMESVEKIAIRSRDLANVYKLMKPYEPDRPLLLSPSHQLELVHLIATRNFIVCELIFSLVFMVLSPLMVYGVCKKARKWMVPFLLGRPIGLVPCFVTNVIRHKRMATFRRYNSEQVSSTDAVPGLVLSLLENYLFIVATFLHCQDLPVHDT